VEKHTSSITIKNVPNNDQLRRLKMKTRMLFVLFSVLLISMLATTVVLAEGPVVHEVSVGGPDACEGFGLKPGCDKNFSLSALAYDDGSASGQWTDRWGGGLGGFHADIDCLVVDGNTAWVSGVVTQGVYRDPETGEEFDLAGLAVGTMVRDNGTSANDPADQISYSAFEIDGPPYDVCTAMSEYPLFDAPQGQVKVK
jgi:hypothetical protein